MQISRDRRMGRRYSNNKHFTPCPFESAHCYVCKLQSRRSMSQIKERRASRLLLPPRISDCLCAVYILYLETRAREKRRCVIGKVFTVGVRWTVCKQTNEWIRPAERERPYTAAGLCQPLSHHIRLISFGISAYS